jgi:hypothetical protein
VQLAGCDSEAQVQGAMSLFDELIGQALDENDLAAATELFHEVNARLYLRYQEMDRGRQKVNRLVGGVVTFGATPPPIPLYEGPTDCGRIQKILKEDGECSLFAGESSNCCTDNGSEVESSRNVRRSTRRCT